MKNIKNRAIPLFMEKALACGKTLIFAGETGSGETTRMKTLIGYIPMRIITIEDIPEITRKAPALR